MEAPLSAFGGGAGTEAVGQAGEVVAHEVNRFAKIEENIANDMRLQQERRALWEWHKTNVLDPEKGAISKVGVNALGVADELQTNYDKFVNEREQGLSNDTQRAAFRQMAQERREHVMDWALKHVNAQSLAVQEDEYQKGLESSAERASLDPTSLPTELRYTRDTVKKRAMVAGWGPEETKQETQKRVSDIHSRFIQAMIAGGKDLAAETYFGHVKSEMDPDTVTKLLPIMEEGSIRGRSQRAVDEIMSKNPTLSDALEKAPGYAGGNSKLRDEIERRVEQRFEIRKKAEQMDSETLYNQSAALVKNNPAVLNGTLHARDVVPPDEWGRMLPAQQKALESIAEDPPNDNRLWIGFNALNVQQVGSLTPAQFEINYWSKFDKEHREKAVSQWNAAKDALNGDKGKQNEFKSILSDKEMVLDAMRISKVSGFNERDTMATVSKNEAKAAALENFMRQADDAYQAFHGTNGKNPNDEQKKTIIRQMMTRRAFVDVWGRDEEKPISAMTPKEKESAYVPIEKIPPNAQKELVNIMRASGKLSNKISDERAMVLYSSRIQRAYAAAIAGGGPDAARTIMNESE